MLPLCAQVEVNQPLSDRYATSWSVHRGHHFYLWSKVMLTVSNPCNILVSMQQLRRLRCSDNVLPQCVMSVSSTQTHSAVSVRLAFQYQ
jgi:hypothetical protein